MAEMERIKLCVIVTQRRVGHFPLRARLKSLEIPLHKTCVTFIEDKVV